MSIFSRFSRTLVAALLLFTFPVIAENALVLQSDFSQKDGAVSAMKGVAFSVDADLPIFDLTHDIPAYNIWEAAYRLYQTASYWPKGTVFVSVVDPGVGTSRHSVVMQSDSGHYFVTPDNGTLTLVAETLGIAAIRQIDETRNRLQGSEKSYTFHGRDVYAYTGARLASGKIRFDEVGPELPKQVVSIPYQAARIDGNQLKGNIPILDTQYGNLWSNISDKMLENAGVKQGDLLCVRISQKETLKYEGTAPYVSSFGEVDEGKPLIYLNSLLNVSLALNRGNFAEKYQVSSGADWSISLTPCVK